MQDLFKMEEVIFIVGGIILIFIFFLLLKKTFKKKQKVVFVVKKITKCKNNDCVIEYKIQGIPDKYFKTFEGAKQYALFLKHVK